VHTCTEALNLKYLSYPFQTDQGSLDPFHTPLDSICMVRVSDYKQASPIPEARRIQKFKVSHVLDHASLGWIVLAMVNLLDQFK